MTSSRKLKILKKPFHKRFRLIFWREGLLPTQLFSLWEKLMGDGKVDGRWKRILKTEKIKRWKELERKKITHL